MRTKVSGSATPAGGAKKSVNVSEYTDVDAPMPSASDTTAMKVNAGDWRSERAARRRLPNRKRDEADGILVHYRAQRITGRPHIVDACVDGRVVRTRGRGEPARARSMRERRCAGRALFVAERLREPRSAQRT